MPIRADNDPRYSRKFLFIGLFAAAYALYFLYDGAIGYPARRVRGFEEFKSDYKAMFTDPITSAMDVTDFEAHADESRLEKWHEYVHERDIPSAPDVTMQFIMAGLTGSIAAFLLSIPLRARGKWIEVDEQGLVSSWGDGFNFDQVELVNKRQWRSKGIAKVTYRDAGGRKRRFVIDDYKFDRYPTDAILYELEQRIEPEKIVNGPPEPPPEARGGDAAPAAQSAAESS
jgi:hypothetical protein